MRYKKHMLIIFCIILIGPAPFVFSRPKLRTNPEDSILVISGTLQMHDVSYITAIPVFPAKPRTVFKDLPEGCIVHTHGTPQSPPCTDTYYFYYIFRDTAVDADCWEYFQGITTLKLNITSARIRKGSAPEDELIIPLIDGGIKMFSVGPLESKGTAGD